jgi:hypothetical protein
MNQEIRGKIAVAHVRTMTHKTDSLGNAQLSREPFVSAKTGVPYHQ